VPLDRSVHPILRRLEEFADLPLVPALLTTIHEQSSEDLMKYKLAPVCMSEPTQSARLSGQLELTASSPFLGVEQTRPRCCLIFASSRRARSIEDSLSM
jgi:hypothetical protein